MRHVWVHQICSKGLAISHGHQKSTTISRAEHTSNGIVGDEEELPPYTPAMERHAIVENTYMGVYEMRDP